MSDDSHHDHRTTREEFRISGAQLIDKVRDIIREGNVRRLHITAADKDFSLEMPMTIGVLAGGAVALAAPWLAVLGVIAALATDVKLEVERDGSPEDDSPEDPGA